MNEIIELTKIDFPSIFISVFTILVGIKAIVSLSEWIISKLGLETKWIRKKREDHNLIVSTVNKVNNMEQIDDAIKHDIDDILTLLKDHIETDKKNTRATFRSSLYRMHSDFTSRGFVTKEGLKTFLECGEAYEKANGDDIYHDKLKPEVMKLPIRETDTDGVMIDEV